MLTKEASIHLSIFVPQSFSRPEGKSFQFGPHQRVRVTLQTYSKTLELSACIPVVYVWMGTQSERIINRNLKLLSLHMAHRTSCLSFGKQRDNTQDKLQSRSSAKRDSKIKFFQSIDQSLAQILKILSNLNHILTSCSQIFTITLAVAVSLWLPEKRT